MTKVMTPTGMVHYGQPRRMADGRTLHQPACKKFGAFKLQFAVEVPDDTPVACKRCLATH